MKSTRVARRYAMGLMAAAEETKTEAQIAKDMTLIGQVLKDSRELRMLLSSPVVSAPKKKSILKEALAAHVSPGMISFVNLMITKNREGLLGEVVEEFQALIDEKLGMINVDVTSAVECAPAQEKTLQDQLEKYTRKKVRIRLSVDKTIRGGLLVKIGDTVLDASIKRQLQLLQERLKGPLSN